MSVARGGARSAVLAGPGGGADAGETGDSPLVSVRARGRSSEQAGDSGAGGTVQAGDGGRMEEEGCSDGDGGAHGRARGPS